MILTQTSLHAEWVTGRVKPLHRLKVYFQCPTSFVILTIETTLTVKTKGTTVAWRMRTDVGKIR